MLLSYPLSPQRELRLLHFLMCFGAFYTCVCNFPKPNGRKIKQSKNFYPMA